MFGSTKADQQAIKEFDFMLDVNQEVSFAFIISRLYNRSKWTEYQSSENVPSEIEKAAKIEQAKQWPTKLWELSKLKRKLD